MPKPRINVVDSGLARPAAAGDGPLLNIVDSALTTVGAGTLLASIIQTGLLLRTGPTAAYADTIDTGANLDAAMPNLAVGDTLDFWYSNNVAFACTITAAAGVTLGTAAANNVVPANSSRLIHLEKVGTASYHLYVI